MSRAWRRQLKAAAVAYLGGACQSCGYNKCQEALDFHHRDPSEKWFSISDADPRIEGELLRAELDKCQLLCANCHREYHAESSTPTATRPSRALPAPELNGWPSKEELQKLVWEFPVTALAKDLGVSATSLTKQCREDGISTPPRGYWARAARIFEDS